MTPKWFKVIQFACMVLYIENNTAIAKVDNYVCEMHKLQG